jgi:hypothetical protein
MDIVFGDLSVVPAAAIVPGSVVVPFPGTTFIPTGQIVVGPLWPPIPPPSVCPGCGRCKDCGQPLAAPASMPSGWAAVPVAVPIWLA